MRCVGARRAPRRRLSRHASHPRQGRDGLCDGARPPTAARTSPALHGSQPDHWALGEWQSSEQVVNTPASQGTTQSTSALHQPFHRPAHRQPRAGPVHRESCQGTARIQPAHFVAHNLDQSPGSSSTGHCPGHDSMTGKQTVFGGSYHSSSWTRVYRAALCRTRRLGAQVRMGRQRNPDVPTGRPDGEVAVAARALTTVACAQAPCHAAGRGLI